MFPSLQTSELIEKIQPDGKQGIDNPEFCDIELETKEKDMDKITQF